MKQVPTMWYLQQHQLYSSIDIYFLLILDKIQKYTIRLEIAFVSYWRLLLLENILEIGYCTPLPYWLKQKT